MTVVDSVEALSARARQALNRNDTEEAVRLLAQVAEQSTAAVSGDSLHPSMAPVWMLYGRALLENARRQSNIFGQTILAQQADKEAVALTMLNGANDSKPADDSATSPEAVPVPDADVDKVAHEEQSDVTNGIDGDENDDDDDDEQDYEDVDEQNDEQEEETGNEDLEAAWEVLETSRLIYSRLEPSSANRLALADVHLLLAEVSQESGRYAEAVSDVRLALQIKSEVLTTDAAASECAPCVLAEAHYRLSSALELDKSDVAEALRHAELAHTLLSKYVCDIQAVMSNSASPNGVSAPAPCKIDKGKQPAKPANQLDLPTATIISTMSRDELAAELDKMKSVIADLSEKIAELRGGSGDLDVQAKQPLAVPQFNTSPVHVEVPVQPAVAAVNDLSAFVKKKKPRLC